MQPSTTHQDVATTSAGMATSGETASTAPTTQTSAATQAQEAFLSGLDLATVVGAVAEGDGPRPTLNWDEIPDASSYTVLVLDSEGRPWWSWSGSSTQVVLGGIDSDLAIGGPTASAGATWIVFAFGSDDAVIGASPQLNLRER